MKRATQILASESPEGPFKPFANKPHTSENWMSLDGTFWVEDGVPYMIFKTFDGRLVTPIHQPSSGKIRERLYELADLGTTLRIQREIPLAAKPR